MCEKGAYGSLINSRVLSCEARRGKAATAEMAEVMSAQPPPPGGKAAPGAPRSWRGSNHSSWGKTERESTPKGIHPKPDKHDVRTVDALMQQFLGKPSVCLFCFILIFRARLCSLCMHVHTQSLADTSRAGHASSAAHVSQQLAVLLSYLEAGLLCFLSPKSKPKCKIFDL